MKIENLDSQQVPRFATRCLQSCSVVETTLTTTVTNRTLVLHAGRNVASKWVKRSKCKKNPSSLLGVYFISYVTEFFSSLISL